MIHKKQFDLIKNTQTNSNTIQKEQIKTKNEKNIHHLLHLKPIIFFYTLSILLFAIYLIFEYDKNIELNYFLRLIVTVSSSILIYIGNKIYNNYYAKTLEDKNKINKIANIIIFIYYITLISNMVILARHHTVNSYNLIPFKSIIELIQTKNFYIIIINILGNFFIFMPLEYFLIYIFHIKRFSLNALISFLIILFIEIIQYIFKVGVFDIDDLILCTSGMIIFYLILMKYQLKKEVKISQN